MEGSLKGQRINVHAERQYSGHTSTSDGSAYDTRQHDTYSSKHAARYIYLTTLALFIENPYAFAITGPKAKESGAASCPYFDNFLILPLTTSTLADSRAHSPRYACHKRPFYFFIQKFILQTCDPWLFICIRAPDNGRYRFGFNKLVPRIRTETTDSKLYL